MQKLWAPHKRQITEVVHNLWYLLNVFVYTYKTLGTLHKVSKL